MQFMPITIQKVKKEDHDKLTYLFCEIEEFHRLKAPWKFSKPKKEVFPIDYFLKILSNKDALFLIAKEKNEIIGFVFGAIRGASDIPILKKRKYFHIDTLMVKKEYRKSGIGKKLMKKIENSVRDLGIKELELEVWNFNTNAIAFYENIDYKPYIKKMRKVLK